MSASTAALPTATAWREALTHHPGLVLGALVLALVLLAAALAPWIAPVDPLQLAPLDRLAPPGAEFWFGADLIGRDVFSRTVYGARVSLAVGLGVVVLASSIGLLIGLISGFVRALDNVLMRIMDGLMAIPSILLAVALIALTGAGLGNVIVAIAVAEVPRVARLARSLTLALRKQPFVDAAIIAGTPFPILLTRHVLPNTLPPLLVQASYIFASAVLTESILSFIGAGTPPSIPSWGNIMADGRSVFHLAPHIVLFPGIALSLTVLAVNLVGDGLRDVLDPRFVKIR